jgi:hypothetical protein
VTPKGTRPRGFHPASGSDPGSWYASEFEPEPDLMLDVRRALADDHPLGLLSLVSSLLAAVDPRDRNPFDRRDEPERPARVDLLSMLFDVDSVETSALLAAVAALGADDVEQRRIRRELAERADELPPWLVWLSGAEAYRTAELTHILGDGDNVMVGVRFPTGEELAAVVYVDHNLGTIVKDAFVVPEPIADLLALFRDKNEDPDAAIADIPLADAKARAVDAIATGAMTIPPYETDTWPACRPLVEWMVGLLPDGGRSYERPEWSDDDQEALADRFLASSFGRGLDDPDHADLLESILWFGCDYGPGDPMRWSPVAVELLLVDWIPRKIVAPVDYLAKAPDVLRPFIRFCHAERGVPSRLTDETMDAVDRWEPDYQAAIRSPRPQGPAALLAAVGALDPEGPWPMPEEDLDDLVDYRELALEWLRSAVGGQAALDTLDDVPLPDEPFAWTGIPDDLHDRVADILDRCDRGCDELLDAECRTAARRVLARIARNGPDALRRRGSTATAAAAICWAVGRANDAFSMRAGGLTNKQLLAHFGVKSSVSDRADTLLSAGGFPRSWGIFTLGSPDYLVSERRRQIIDRRDRHYSS